MNSGTVIVGASVGGVRTAQSLRTMGYSDPIIVIEQESHLPYDKPPLSKGFLSGSLGLDRLHLITESEIKSLTLELKLGTSASRLDVAKSHVSLANGETIGYDNLVIATGVRARPSPWEATDGVHLLRTLDDSIALRSDFENSKSVVIVGGGFIGAEVAATARGFGLEVTIVDPLEIPMGRVLGDSVGKRFIDLHHQNDVKTFFGVGVESIAGSKGNLEVTLSNGSRMHADLVVVGIGAVTNDQWLSASGLLIDNGVVCDEFCRAVDSLNIFAVGDIARWQHQRHGRLERVEHWTNAVDQATLVAHNIVSPEDMRPYVPVEYVWSDQYDWKIQIAGLTAEAADQIVLEDPSNLKRFAALYVDEAGQFCGVATVSWPRVLIECRKQLLAGETDITKIRARLDPILNPKQ